MDACFNVFCTNAIYKHINHGEYTNMYIVLKWCQKGFVEKIFNQKKKKKKLKFFSRYVNLSSHVVTKM